jgi:hypothetical protein
MMVEAFEKKMGIIPKYPQQQIEQYESLGNPRRASTNLECSEFFEVSMFRKLDRSQLIYKRTLKRILPEPKSLRLEQLPPYVISRKSDINYIPTEKT